MIHLCLKWRPYQLIWVNKLMEQNMRDHLEFCHWFLAQDEEFGQHAIWTDEKYFVLQPAPNMKNDFVWAPWNSKEEVECKRQGDSKVYFKI